MRVIAVANQKGGCGKTTTSINFAAALALLQKKILLLDLDPQGHSTCGLGIDPSHGSKTLYDLLSPREGLKPLLQDLIHTINPYFGVVPSYEILRAAEEELNPIPHRDKILRDFLHEAERSGAPYDYCIMDCPPNLGILTHNAFQAADEVLIPIEPSFFSLHGLAKISETLNGINRHRVDPVEIHALLTIFNSRTRFAREVYEEVKSHFKEKLFKTIIHECVSLREAAGAGKSIVDYDQKSMGFRDYFHLGVEYLEREWDRKLPEASLGWESIVRNKYGPRLAVGGILFQAFNKEAKGIEIAGDFNQWIPEPLLHRDPPGLWQKILMAPKGSYRYKLIVDGEWQMDPYQSVQRPNAFGTFDSYLEVH